MIKFHPRQNVMAKRKRQRGRKTSKSRRSQPQPPPAPESHKWLLIFCAIICVVIAALWGIKSLLTSDEKSQKEESPLILTEQNKPSTIPSSLTPGEEIAVLKEQEMKLAQALLQEFPDSVEPLVLLGNIHRKYGNSTEAITFWKKALHLDSKRPDVYDGMAMIAMEKEEYEEAITLWRKVIDINPRMAEIRTYVAQALMQLGRYNEAMNELQEEIKILPKSRAAHYLLGQVNLKLKHYDQAKICYQNTIAIDPNYISAYYGLFTVCTRLKQKTEAQEYMATFKRLRAKDLKALKSRNEALDDLVESRKAAADTYMSIEQVYSRRGRLEKSEELLKKAVTLNPKNLACFLRLAYFYEMSNRISDALQILEAAGKIHAQNADFHLHTGTLSARLKRFTNAEQAFRKAITLAPQFSGGYSELAQLYLKTGTKLSEAMKLAKTAVELEETAANYFILSWAYDKNGDVTNARSALKRATELDPENPKYRRMYELILKRDSSGDS
jgi:tetratricopeptide (TPR) repeat protein